MDKPQIWRCGYCKNFATIREDDVFCGEERISNYHDTILNYVVEAITCLNPSCRQLNLSFKIVDITPLPPKNFVTSPMAKKSLDKFWRLLPESSATIFPSFVPKAIRDDYEEACKIVNLSPKSSATLARRCIQSIIKNFWGIQDKDNLNDEIKALLQMQDLNSDLIGAFHGIRSIGNIGAHMDKDVNHIIEIEPEEAEVLVEFIEQLINLTYIEKHNHDEQIEKIKNICIEKQKKKILKSY